MRMTTLIFDYVCARCWSPLIEREGKAICARDQNGEHGHGGYHRLSGVNWQRAHNEIDRQEVIRTYQDIPPFSYQLGLAQEPTKITAQKFSANKRVLGRDDSGL